MFRSVKGPNSCYIGNQLLCFHWIALSKGFDAQERILTSISGFPTTKTARSGQKMPKLPPKIARSAQAGDPADVTLVTIHLFVEWPWVKLLGLERRFLHQKVAPRPQNGLNWQKNAKNHPPNITFRSVRGPSSCNTGNQPLCFHQIGLSNVLRAQERTPTSQNSSPATKTAWVGQKTPKIISKISRSALSGDPIAVTLVTNHSIFIELP